MPPRNRGRGGGGGGGGRGKAKGGRGGAAPKAGAAPAPAEPEEASEDADLIDDNKIGGGESQPQAPPASRTKRAPPVCARLKPARSRSLNTLAMMIADAVDDEEFDALNDETFGDVGGGVRLLLCVPRPPAPHASLRFLSAVGNPRLTSRRIRAGR